MSTLYFATWSDAKEVAAGYPLNAASITVGAAWTAPRAVDPGVRRILLWPRDADMLFEAGENPDGSGKTIPLPMGQQSYHWINGGDSFVVKEI
jgi:hypothetical protein